MYRRLQSRESQYKKYNIHLIEGLSDDGLGWWKAFMPKGQFGEGGDPYNLTQEQKDQNMGFKMQVYADGF